MIARVRSSGSLVEPVRELEPVASRRHAEVDPADPASSLHLVLEVLSAPGTGTPSIAVITMPGRSPAR